MTPERMKEISEYLKTRVADVSYANEIADFLRACADAKPATDTVSVPREPTLEQTEDFAYNYQKRGLVKALAMLAAAEETK